MASSGIVDSMELLGQAAAAEQLPRERALDAESRDWLDALRADGVRREEAIARLHALLLRAARFETGRRRPTLPHLRGDELGDIAREPPTTLS